MQIDTRKILSTYGLKYNPFDTDKPASAIFMPPRLNKEIWRIETLVMEGGIAGIISDPGTGKSVFLRYLANHLEKIPDIQIVHMDRPQSSLSDFYRELGAIFDLELKVSHRWGGFRALRDKWLRHTQATLFRPILMIDEAQLMHHQTLTELRLLSSEKFDSRKLLTIILAGDQRLAAKLTTPDLLPLNSRMRRIEVARADKEELIMILQHLLKAAGNESLMSDGLIKLLVDHACGNPRKLMGMSSELLVWGAIQEKDFLDEGLFYDIYQEKLGKPNKPRRSI
jgi:type II secretory pathway predicted ATPase ExeA